MQPLRSDPIDLRDLAAGARVQLRCLRALMIRDLMVRYGRNNIGFLWVVLEPMILTGGVMVVWSMIRPPNAQGVQLISFVLTGYMPLTLWRHLTQAGVFPFRRSMGLMYHRHISMIDVLLARQMLEFAGTTCAFLVVYGVLLAAGLVAPMVDPGLLLLGWVLMGWLSFGFSLGIAILTEWTDVAERFVQPIQYLMLPISGCFYMVDWLPTVAQELAWYVPMVHCYEMIRAGFFGDSVQTYYTTWYVALWSLVLTAVGLWGLDKVRDRIHYG